MNSELSPSLDRELSDLIDAATGPLSEELREKIGAAVAQSSQLLGMAAEAEDIDVRRRLFETAEVPLVTAAALFWTEGTQRKNEAVKRLTRMAIRAVVLAA